VVVEGAAAMLLLFTAACVEKENRPRLFPYFKKGRVLLAAATAPLFAQLLGEPDIATDLTAGQQRI